MSVRTLRTCVLLAVVSFTLGRGALAQEKWAVEKTFYVGGEGGWDYVTLDAQNHRHYVSRCTHTMAIGADSGKTLADIPGQPGASSAAKPGTFEIAVVARH